MGVIWFKDRPKPIALTPDGRLNLVPFKLDPDTIAINGIEGLVAKDSKSEGTFEQVLSMGLFQATAGSREDPLVVEGEPLGGNRQPSTKVIQDLRDEMQLLRSGGAESGLLGMEELQSLAAFAKQQMTKAQSVHLSGLNSDQWDNIRKNAGLDLKPYTGEISGLDLQPATPFEWSEAPEASQASQYLTHIRSHIQHDKKYCMFDARRYRQLLTVAGMQAELGFKVRGTTDAALVLHQSIAVGAAANGLRWLWELKRQLHAPTEGMPAGTSSTLPSSSSDDADQELVDSRQSKAACQAMAALLLANIHAPDLKPAITLTDLRDSHSIFWLDGLSIMYYAAPDAATAWALTNALLIRDPEGHSNTVSIGQLPHSLEPFAKRQKLDVHRMRGSGGELAQLAELADSINSHETKLSTTACMLKQLFNMPAFCTEDKPPRPIPYGIYT